MKSLRRVEDIYWTIIMSGKPANVASRDIHVHDQHDQSSSGSQTWSLKRGDYEDLSGSVAL